jgi:hypothetical protein
MRAATAIAALMIALLPAVAYAQKTQRSDADKKTDQEIERAYKDVMSATGTGGGGATRGPAPKGDPWGTIRPTTSDSGAGKK